MRFMALLLLLIPLVNGYNVFVGLNSSQGACASNESHTVGNIFNLATSRVHPTPVAVTSWIDDWDTEGFLVLNLGTFSFAHEWEKFPMVLIGTNHDDLVELTHLTELNEWWNVFSVSILAKSAVILFTHDAASNLTTESVVDVVNLDVSTDDSPVRVTHCKKFKKGGDLDSCNPLPNKQHFNGSALKNGTEWSHFQFSLSTWSSRNGSKRLKIAKFNEDELVADIILSDGNWKNGFAMSPNGTGMFKVHTSKMLFPMDSLEQTMSRKFHQQHVDGTVFVKVSWQTDLVADQSVAQLHVKNLATDATKEYPLIEHNDQRSSFLKINLEPGDFQLTLKNISGRGIKSIDVVKSNEVLKYGADIIGCQFFITNNGVTTEQVFYSTLPLSCSNFGTENGAKICALINEGKNEKCEDVRICDEKGCFLLPGVNHSSSLETLVAHCDGNKGELTIETNHGSIWPKFLVGSAVTLLVVFMILGYLFWYKRRYQTDSDFIMGRMTYANISREPIFSQE